MMNHDRLTDEQRKLIINNRKLLNNYIGYIIKNRIVPKYLEDEFISDMHLRFCISALKYDIKTGFKFSTYAYGGFRLGLKYIINQKKPKYERMSYRQKIDDDCIGECKKEIEIEVVNEFVDSVVLTNKERSMLEDYFYNKISFLRIGIKHGISKEWARLTVKKALGKLKEAVKEREINIEDFYK